MDLRSCQKLDKSSMDSGFLDSFDYVLTDCDGVIYNGSEAIPGSVEAIQALHNMGKHVIYVTNNSYYSRKRCLEKIKSFGLPITLDTIITASYCVGEFLKSVNFKRKVYVLGSSGITDELDKCNIEYLPIGEDPIVTDFADFVKTLELDPEVGAVVIGFDPLVSYPKLTKASSYLKDHNTIFIAADRDDRVHTPLNVIIPGTGTLVGAVEAVTKRQAVHLGKPEKYMLQYIKQIHSDIDFNRCIMIGDRLNTDIMLGTKHGLKTLFVLTGVNTLDDVHAIKKSESEANQLLVPDFYLQCLGDLLPLIKT